MEVSWRLIVMDQILKWTCSWLANIFSKLLEIELKLDSGLYFVGSFLERYIFLSSALTWPFHKFEGNVLVSIEMLIMSVMGVINMSRKIF